MLKLVKLEQFAKRKPHQLSGGQRQRVALARSVAKRPKVLLLDEPLGALDKKLREETQFELMDLQQSLGLTFVVVTHDQEEAMTMADRIAILDKGEVMQVATPAEIYEAPNSRFVAGFVGNVNMFEGKVAARDAGTARITGASGAEIVVENAGDAAAGNTVAFAIRPEKIKVSSRRPEGATNAMEGEVYDLAYLGDMTVYHVRLDDGQVVKASALNSARASDDAAELERPRLDILPARCRRRADQIGAAMSNVAISTDHTASSGAASRPAASRAVAALVSRLVIIVPYLWLLVFFLIPFVIVFKISLSQTAIAMPPYVPALSLDDGISGLFSQFGEMNFDNYVWLTEDALYINAYVSSIVIAAISTFLTLLVGYPIAYGMARAPATLRPTLLMLVILPFWTSFLIRVYAWIGILKPEGLLNQFLQAVGVINEPLLIMNTNTAIYIGIVYSYLPVHDPAAVFGAGKDGLFAHRGRAGSGLSAHQRLLEDHLSAVAARCGRRLHAGLHPRRRRVRHPRPARRLADADDRQDAVERVLQQP